MKDRKGYAIIDENGKYVVGYVKEENKFCYIAYDTTESCAVRLFKTEKSVTDYIEQLNKIAVGAGECHHFSYRAIY
jgi:hypothetical protein